MAKVGSIITDLRKGRNKFGIMVAKELYIMGKTQTWLAEQCGVTKQYISQIVNGQRTPSPEVTEKIANIFNCDVRELRSLVLQSA